VATAVPIPGSFVCPRCNFRLAKAVIYRQDGSITADPSTAREVCPNDGASLEQAYESPDDRLVVTRPCECLNNPECPGCWGTNERVVGWRYRDEERVRPFSDEGDR